MAGSLLLTGAAPPTKRADHVDELHGVKVPDPYRWLETESDETKAWVRAQSEHARAHIARIAGRDRIQKLVTEMHEYTRSAPYAANAQFAGIVKKGNRYFFLKQEGLQNQPVLYIQEQGSAPRELINPNTMSSEGIAALSMWSVSPDGKWLAYGVAKAGSDWQQWRVRNVETGQDTGDEIEWTKFSFANWAADSRGFYYTRYPEVPKEQLLTAANYNSRIHYHRLGDKQASDKLIYERPDQPSWRFSAEETSGGRYLLINISDGTRVEGYLQFKDLQSPATSFRDLTPKFDSAYEPFGGDGRTLYLYTNWKAPKYRVMAIDLENPDQSKWREVVPEARETLIQTVYSGGRLVLGYLKDARSLVRIHAADGKPVREVELPGLGTATWGMGDAKQTEHFYSFVSFTQPELIYRYDMATGKSTPFFTTKLPVDPATVETKQVFVTSKDGTRVPMFLIHRKGLRLTGANPVLLYAYGGFNVSLQPSFSPLYLSWAGLGGVTAIANLRGGGEYGEEWHKAGMLHNKQNVFDDFIAAGEWLIANKYTSNKKLAIYGGSNGGLLVGACLSQRPDLYGAAIPAVGVMDMLRFHKFTIGYAWASEYGSPDDPEHFATLVKYSPLHNIKRGVQYPPTLVMTADHDDRVVPLHSFKYGAALQYAQEGPAPILIRIDTSAGHGGGKPTSKRIEDSTDILAFLKQSLGMK